MMVLPSDHHIGDVEAFRATLADAVAAAAEGTITTVGVTPTRPETGYGYIQVNNDVRPPAGASLAKTVRRFVEKPSADKAERFVADGSYLWNAGMFFFRVGDMLDAIRAHMPALAVGLDTIVHAARVGRAEEAEAIASVFPTLPSVSIDRGVMERLTRLAVVQGEFGWSDLGSWQSAWELSRRDVHGNASNGDTVFVDARNNHVVDLRTATHKRVTAVVGIDDLVVVETDDALLVVPRSRAQDVRAAVEALKSRGDHDLT
jgi:mannose-1-phosphate guanylyltransferase